MIWPAREEIENTAAPEFPGLRECPEIKTCDNPKVVATSAEGNPQVAVLMLVGIDNLS